MRRLAVLAALVAALAVAPPAAGQAGADEGARLYLRDCAWCHGPNGEGTNRGPGLEDSGEASAFYYLSTGRMPIEEPEQPTRSEPAYDDGEIAALVAHVAELGTGPDFPAVDPGRGNLARGGELFRINCASCHGFAGSGGALSGREAPPVTPSTATEAVAAMAAGPGQMPSFDALGDRDVADIAAYVEYLGEAEHAGGAELGAVGPVAEGLLAAVAALVLLVLVRWGIAGRRARSAPRRTR